MHTEDEAKKLWCPHTIASHTNPRQKTYDTRDKPREENSRFEHNCIASRCSQWRWCENMAEPTDKTMQFRSTYDRTPDDPGFVWKLMKNDEDVIEWVKCKILPRKGYCGLAGKP